MKKLKSITTLFLILFISNLFAQNIEECGLDENFELTKTESEYLNNYLKEKRKEFDFNNKKIIIVSGNAGQQIGSKKQYFKDIKSWLEKESQIATTLIIFNEEEKLKSGCDGILTLWVKIFTEKEKRKIIKKLTIEKDKTSR
jgi:hypothetical protein